MNKTILFAVLCALFVATAVASSDFAAENQAMWLKYRYHLVHHLSRHFCAVNGQGHPCPLMDSTVFQMVDEPRDALWHRSKFYLNEDVAKFVPAWKTTFEPQCTGVDCTITNVYEKMLKSFPNAGEGAQAFVNYMRAPTESYADKGVSKSYPWNESGETLQNFVNQMQGKADYGWSFSIDRNTPQQNSYPWGLKAPLVVADKSFVRKINNNGAVTAMSDFFFVKKNNTKAVVKVEAEEESDEVEDQTLSAAEFLFRRRRSAPPPPAPVPIQQIIKTNHFAISFFAKDIRAINIVPGTWFNHDLLRRYGPQLSGWWGSAGKLSLLPRTVYVAYQPKVEIVVSESQLGGVKQQLDQTGVLAWLVGGIHFKGYNTHAMSDEDAFADRVYIEEVASESEKRELTEVEKKQLTRKSVLSGNDEFASEQQHEEQADKVEDQTMSAADFLFRRRRRAPPPPPPPPPPPKLERNFKIVFESNSPSPQILGVVSTVLPA